MERYRHFKGIAGKKEPETEKKSLIELPSGVR